MLIAYDPDPARFTIDQKYIKIVKPEIRRVSIGRDRVRGGGALLASLDPSVLHVSDYPRHSSTCMAIAETEESFFEK